MTRRVRIDLASGDYIIPRNSTLPFKPGDRIIDSNGVAHNVRYETEAEAQHFAASWKGYLTFVKRNTPKASTEEKKADEKRKPAKSFLSSQSPLFTQPKDEKTWQQELTKNAAMQLTRSEISRTIDEHKIDSSIAEKRRLHEEIVQEELKKELIKKKALTSQQLHREILLRANTSRDEMLDALNSDLSRQATITTHSAQKLPSAQERKTSRSP
jgi:hypothetical protein